MFSYLLAKETDRRIKLPCHALPSGATEASCLQAALTDQLGMNAGLCQWGCGNTVLKTSFYTLLWGRDQASVFSLVVFMLILCYLTSSNSSTPRLSVQRTTESRPSSCLKTVKHSLTHFPTLLQAGPRPDPKHGISWRSVLLGGKEKGWEVLRKSNSVPCESKNHLK